MQRPPTILVPGGHPPAGGCGLTGGGGAALRRRRAATGGFVVLADVLADALGATDGASDADGDGVTTLLDAAGGGSTGATPALSAEAADPDEDDCPAAVAASPWRGLLKRNTPTPVTTPISAQINTTSSALPFCDLPS